MVTAMDMPVVLPDDGENATVVEAACSLVLVDKVASIVGKAVITGELATVDMALDVGFPGMSEEAD